MIQSLRSWERKLKIHSHKYINTNESTHSEMAPVRQNPINRTLRTAHLSMCMTVNSFSTQHSTEIVLITSHFTSGQDSCGSCFLSEEKGALRCSAHYLPVSLTAQIASCTTTFVKQLLDSVCALYLYRRSISDSLWLRQVIPVCLYCSRLHTRHICRIGRQIHNGSRVSRVGRVSRVRVTAYCYH